MTEEKFYEIEFTGIDGNQHILVVLGQKARFSTKKAAQQRARQFAPWQAPKINLRYDYS